MPDFKELFKQQSAQAAEALGHTDKGYKNLENSQQDLFSFGATKLGVEKGQNANETAGNIVSKLTSGLGTSTAADVLRAGLQTAATVGLDPANVVAPGAGMRGTVAKVGESAVAKKLAQQALQSGDMSTVNAIAKASADNLLQIIPRSTPQGLDVLKASRVPTNARGIKIIGGANEVVNPAIKPANMSKVSLRDPLVTATEKVTSGEKIGFSPAVSTADQVRVQKILADIKRRAGG